MITTPRQAIEKAIEAANNGQREAFQGDNGDVSVVAWADLARAWTDIANAMPAQDADGVNVDYPTFRILTALAALYVKTQGQPVYLTRHTIEDVGGMNLVIRPQGDTAWLVVLDGNVE